MQSSGSLSLSAQARAIYGSLMVKPNEYSRDMPTQMATHDRGQTCHNWLRIPYAMEVPSPWSSKSQEIVSLSTTESEYVAATHGHERSPLAAAASPLKSSSPSNHLPPSSRTTRQPLSTHVRPPVPLKDQAHRCALPLHPMGHRAGLHASHLLPN